LDTSSESFELLVVSIEKLAGTRATDGYDKDCEGLIMEIQGRFSFSPISFSAFFLSFSFHFFVIFCSSYVSWLWSALWLLSGSGFSRLSGCLLLGSLALGALLSLIFILIFIFFFRGFSTLQRVFPNLGFSPLSLHRRKWFFPLFFFLRGAPEFNSLYFFIFIFLRAPLF
jgi:hypothetical protein